MYRDTYIKLILKEILRDPSLVSFIYQILDAVEINEALTEARWSSFDLRNDIKLLYPGLFRTALFEHSKFTIDDDLEPGYSFYNVQSLTPCGHLVEWRDDPPTKFVFANHDVNRKQLANSISIVNRLHKSKRGQIKYDQDFIKKLLKKRNRYHDYELRSDVFNSGKGIWYDFENKEFHAI